MKKIKKAKEERSVIRLYLEPWRTFRRLTQEKLAERVGLSPASISQLENGKQGFTSETLADLAKALDCTPADLMVYNPKRADSFWPLLQAAERLEGKDRQFVYRMISTAVAPNPDESE